MYRRQVSLNPHLLERMLLSKQIVISSLCVHTLEIEDNPVIKNLT